MLPKKRPERRKAIKGKSCHPQAGNALFLILIAVALFAALSYAVTQSGRGGGSVSKETEMLDAARISQYAASVRSAATRIIITGTSIADLEICPVSDGDQRCAAIVSAGAGETCNSATAAVASNCVYAPEGGGITMQNFPAGNGNTEIWYFFHENATSAANIQGVGTTAADIRMETGNPGGSSGLSLSLCQALNKGLGITTLGTDANGWPGGFTAYNGQPFFCYDDTSDFGGQYFYVHTLVER